MLAVSGGRMICLSTPHGKRGFFYQAWAKGGADWHRIEVPAERIPRITPEFLQMERRTIGESWFRQEYCCSFEALEGLVYPDFSRCEVPGPAPLGRRGGGIDFGLRNPTAAVWGVLDRDDILWLTGEHYSRGQSLRYHAQHLPRVVVWYADPEGAREILELRSAGLTIRPGDNECKVGIQAVRARLEEGTLKVVAGSCPNLLAEAALYRYATDGPARSENPVKEYDHTLDALRYMISQVDTNRMARIRKASSVASPGQPSRPAPPAKPKRKWLSLYNEALWTILE
jgi:hypothetical protein